MYFLLQLVCLQYSNIFYPSLKCFKYNPLEALVLVMWKIVPTMNASKALFRLLANPKLYFLRLKVHFSFGLAHTRFMNDS